MSELKSLVYVREMWLLAAPGLLLGSSGASRAGGPAGGRGLAELRSAGVSRAAPLTGMSGSQTEVAPNE